MPNQVNQRILEIKGQAQFADAFADFADLCAANQDILKLSPAQLLEIEGASTKMNTKLAAWLQAKTVANQAKVDKDEEFAASYGIVSQYSKVFRSDPTIGDPLLELLMLAPHNPTRSSTPPSQPTQFTATADGLGLVEARWKANGNKPGTMYVIEYRTSANGPWQVLAVTSQRRFVYQWTAGEYFAIRATAQRGTEMSQPSYPAILWDGGGENVVMLKAA